jgi:hypothetical protein
VNFRFMPEVLSWKRCDGKGMKEYEVLRIHNPQKEMWSELPEREEAAVRLSRTPQIAAPLSLLLLIYRTAILHVFPNIRCLQTIGTAWQKQNLYKQCLSSGPHCGYTRARSRSSAAHTRAHPLRSSTSRMFLHHTRAAFAFFPSTARLRGTLYLASCWPS